MGYKRPMVPSDVWRGRSSAASPTRDQEEPLCVAFSCHQHARVVSTRFFRSIPFPYLDISTFFPLCPWQDNPSFGCASKIWTPLRGRRVSPRLQTRRVMRVTYLRTPHPWVFSLAGYYVPFVCTYPEGLVFEDTKKCCECHRF